MSEYGTHHWKALLEGMPTRRRAHRKRFIHKIETVALEKVKKGVYSAAEASRFVDKEMDGYDKEIESRLSEIDRFQRLRKAKEDEIKFQETDEVPL